MGAIVLGTSGWDYPEWTGRFYPRPDVTDRLRYYASVFPAVEINTTFYRLPTRGTVQSWARRTPSRFRFTAKFPRTITHERRLIGTGDELARFLDVLAPLRESEQLAALLLQLPPSLPFEPVPVRTFYESLPADLPVAVEFREPTWLDPASFDLLREFHLAYVVVDEPRLPVRLDVTAPFAYVRWHGHGSPLWYDYTYSSEELHPWVGRLHELAERVGTVYGFFNNHFRGDAAVNGLALTSALGLPPPPWSRRLEV